MPLRQGSLEANRPFPRRGVERAGGYGFLVPPPPPLTPEQRIARRRFADAWTVAAPRLAEERARSIRATDQASASAALDPLIDRAVATMPSRDAAGMIAMQALFRRKRAAP